MTSKALFVYLQRPDTGTWITVGRYTLDESTRTGVFRYAPRYLEAGTTWSIDPVNLPLLPGIDQLAPRYEGLHDVLRDACPDSWGQMLLRRKYHLPDEVHASSYLRLAKNGDRWGALAVGTSRTPSIDVINSPKLAQLDGLAQELLAMYERRAPLNARIRNMLMATPSLGGARPKGTLTDGNRFWLVKPALPSDTVDIPALEHFTLRWGAAIGLRTATSLHHQINDGLSVLRVCRFDRDGDQRHMTLSGASLLSAEYPGGTRSAWSYPRLAETLKQIGAPLEDRIELFDRMIFNAMIGNDDDHPRNHAVCYDLNQKRWRLSPAFDLVPNPDEHPVGLSMQLSAGRFDIARASALADAHRFGFASGAESAQHLDQLTARIVGTIDHVDAALPDTLRAHIKNRLAQNRASLSEDS